MLNKPNQKLLYIIIALLSTIIIVGIFVVGYIAGNHRSMSHYSNMNRHGYQFMSDTSEIKKGFWRNRDNEGFGVKGVITQINGNILTVIDRGQTEKKVMITENTQFKNSENSKETVTREDITVDQGVIIIGSPNKEGLIEAKIIMVRELYW